MDLANGPGPSGFAGMPIVGEVYNSISGYESSHIAPLCITNDVDEIENGKLLSQKDFLKQLSDTSVTFDTFTLKRVASLTNNGKISLVHL